MSKDNRPSASRAGFVYYVLIFLTVLDIFVILFAGFAVLLGILTEATGQAIEIGSKSFTISPIFKIVCGIILGICAICFPVLTIQRQKYRDLYEYDEKGNSRKRGSMSQLSAAERKQLEIQRVADNERILPSGVKDRITHKGSENVEQEMKSLIGLWDVKKDIKEMEARMIYENQRFKEQHKRGKFKNTQAQHMIFYGPPGTGKTTCARIMAGILYKHGYIKKNQCVEVDGNFFSGLSDGETAKKTNMLLDHAMGGVLFIDEAYSLGYMPAGREVIATLVKEMEDHRDEFVVILAGYDKEMKDLVNMNPGISSRVKKYMHFASYTVEELKQILLHMANDQGFCVDISMMDAFERYIGKELRSPNFGNARAVRAFVDRAIDKHALNLMEGVIGDEYKCTLVGQDMPDLSKTKF